MCEDFPCCGHDYGDCEGRLYGSDEAIMASVRGHEYCDHADGIFECADEYYDDLERDEHYDE